MKTLLLAVTVLLCSFSPAQTPATPDRDRFPWSATFARYGLSDSISEAALFASQGRPFYLDTPAAGLWALTPPVALYYGLEINRHQDQRYDPLIAADAAARYIRDLIIDHGHDTVSALIAYRLGAARFSDFLRTDSACSPLLVPFSYSLTPTLDSICRRTSGIPVTISSPIRIATLLDSLHIPTRLFRLLNPAVTSSSWLLPPASVYLPDTSRLASLFPAEQAVFDSVTVASRLLAESQTAARLKAIKAANAEIIYRVRSGDTLGAIARRHRVTVRQIKAWNGLKSDLIRIGQRLRIKPN